MSPTTNEMMQFEKAIAYFYGVPNSRHIAQHYLEALRILNTLDVNSTDDTIEPYLLPHLEQAYNEVLKQTGLQFNVPKVAKFEFTLIVSQARKAPFETIHATMLELYREVFQSDAFSIHKAAMLRTFLFLYKSKVLQQEHSLTENDKKLMLSLAKVSEEELKLIISS